MKKKTSLLIASVALGISMSAAELTVVSTEKLEAEGYYPTISPTGSVLLFTSEDHDGLKMLDLASKEVNVIDENPGTGFDPVFSSDGKEIVYRTIVRQDGLIRRDVQKFDLTTGQKVQLLEPSRKVVNTRALLSKTFAYGLADKQAIEVSIAGDTRVINPIQAGYRYIWTSVSPSNNKLLFNEINSGLYVSELDGTQAKHLATRAEFPCWVDDNYVIALYTEDDGYVVTKSKIIAINVETGESKYLTDDNVLVNGITAVSNKIVYATEEGQMYIMNIKIAE